MRYDLPNYVTTFSAIPTADIAATANGSPIDLEGYIGKILLRVDAANATAGTNPTLDIAIKESTDNSNWTNSNVAFTQITAKTSQVLAYDTRAHGRYMRLDKTIGGTNSPSFPAGVTGVAQLQYNPA